MQSEAPGGGEDDGGCGGVLPFFVYLLMPHARADMLFLGVVVWCAGADGCLLLCCVLLGMVGGRAGGMKGTFRYGSYDQIKNELGATGGNIPIWKKVLASCFAGGMGSFLAVPCDLVKIRMQADAAGTRYKSTMSAFAEVAKKEGVKGMWRGAGPTVSRAAVGAMTELPVYDEVKSAAINAGIVQPGIQSHLFSALCAGFFSTFWMNPFDVAKSRESDNIDVSPTSFLVYSRALVFKGGSAHPTSAILVR